jgi:hypothetical protein
MAEAIFVAYRIVYLMKMVAFWFVAPCSLLEVYRRFRSIYCHHHQGDKHLCNGGKLQPDYTTQQPRKQP